MSRVVRCAVYTRKSSEEGLEQDFNSLHAQREACAAYVMSQAGEGWSLMDEAYDDGGISGGTLERPGLKRLLADIAAKRIDIVVVYKVDRLTRSLLDFAKLVEAFDAAGTSFVSVTQSFNTTTSMGRLTLNMLLSFAQFEREVTAERIRDKIAASKARGMWMGGTPPLGYAPDGRTLVIVPEHAALVRDIYQRYLDTGNVRLVAEALEREGIRSPIRKRRSGEEFGDKGFTRGQLYKLLSNPIYIGQVPHRDTTYPGLHEPILDLDTWTATQTMLAANLQGDRQRTLPNRSVLAGKIVSADGEPLIAAHACKGKVRYRYYVSRALQSGSDDKVEGVRIPAREIELAAAECIARLFDDPVELMSRGALLQRAGSLTTLAEQCTTVAEQLRAGSLASPLSQIVEQIRVMEDHFEIELSSAAISSLLEMPSSSISIPNFTIICEAALKRTGRSKRLVQRNGAQMSAGSVDPSLVRALVKARRWWGMLAEGHLDTSKLAEREGVTRSYLTRIVRLNFLAPALVEAILDGNLHSELDTDALTQPNAIPALWSEQVAHMLPAKPGRQARRSVRTIWPLDGS